MTARDARPARHTRSPKATKVRFGWLPGATNVTINGRTHQIFGRGIMAIRPLHKQIRRVRP